MTTCTTQFHLHIYTQTPASYYNMGRRAKHLTAADKALAAKGYNFKYNQSLM
jgi:hypothetical protein